MPAADGATPENCAVTPQCLIDYVDHFARVPNELGRNYIDEAIRSGPSRRVRRSPHHSAMRYSSEKRGEVVEAESVSLEYVLALECEHNSRVAQFSSQLPPIDLDYINAQNKRVVTSIRPDAFVELDDGRIAIVETKPEDKAHAEHIKGNPRFQPSSMKGCYIDSPANAATARHGLPFIVLTTDAVNHTLVSNLIFLGKGGHRASVASRTTEALVCHVQRIGVSTYEELAKSEDWSADDLIHALNEGMVWVDIYRDRITGPAPTPVYRCKEFADLVRSGSAQIEQRPKFPPPQEAIVELSRCSSAALKEAWTRLAAIREVLAGNQARSTLSRSEKNWHQRYLAAECDAQAGFLGLIPHYHARGHRGCKLAPKVEELLTLTVQEGACEQARYTGRYGQLRATCRELGLAPPSKTTFHKRLRAARAELRAIHSARGKDAAYQAQPAEKLTTSTISRLAQRSWQSATLDHTPLPIRLVETLLGTPIANSPWLTYMRDDADGGIRGVYLSFQRPTTLTVQSTLWDCYRRYQRFPETLRLDGEKPHDSIAVEKLLAHERIDKLCRRYMSPRDGSGIERGFSLFQHALLAYLNGNYVLRQDPKSWERGWRPDQLADRTLGSLWLATEEFFFDYYNTSFASPKTSGLSPDGYQAASARAHGARAYRVSTDLDADRPHLLPLVSRGGMRKLDRQNGIRIHGQRYLPNKPISPEFYGHTYIVKFDPLDITYIYVSLGGKWTDFCHQYAHQFSGLSSARLAGYSREIVELAQRHEAASPERAEQLGALLERVAQIPHDPLAQWEESRIGRNSQKEEVMEDEPVSPFAIHGDIHSCPTFQSGDE
ncbi:hypothetical protein KHP57_04755 [Algiphilus sp. NNCM1]|uniref:hypothetical protein n=1 Tax=Algiphilus TaxID=1266053 RepID=UPI0009FC2F79|nr:hypothetical protein [Algiphilus aromaticivorans]MBY8965007.1 hypothetical protein [Algiphilus acroporae]